MQQNVCFCFFFSLRFVSFANGKQQYYIIMYGSKGKFVSKCCIMAFLFIVVVVVCLLLLPVFS